MWACLVDRELPVQVPAAIAFAKVLLIPQAAVILQGGLGKIMTVYIELLNNVESDEVVTALEEIVIAFPECMAPFAVSIVVTLDSSFHKHYKELHDNFN